MVDDPRHVAGISSKAASAALRSPASDVNAITGGGIVPLRPPGCDGVTAPAGTRTPVDCGDLPFLIRRDGTWLYRGSPIGRKSMVCLFASVLKRDPTGAFLLETPVERGRIEVEDAPFVAVELDWHGQGRDQVLYLRTNVDETIAIGPDHPLRVAHDLLTCEPTPYVVVRAGQGPFPIEARVSRSVYYELVALAEPGVQFGKRVLGVWSQSAFFSLGEIAHPVE